MSFQADIETEHWENYECPKRCIGFGEFLMNNYHKHNDNLHWYDGNSKDGFNKYTTKELYELFKQQK